MPTYKDKAGKLHFIEDANFEHFLPDGCARITDEEANALSTPTIAESKAFKWETIKAKRDQCIEKGGYKIGTKWFHSDMHSRNQQLGLVLLGANIPANLQWKTMDGNFILMTPILAQKILEVGAASDMAIFAAAETHKAAMEASASPASYNLSEGWPKGFGE